MDTGEARASLEMVDRILASGEYPRSLRMIGTVYIAWGLAAAITSVTVQTGTVLVGYIALAIACIYQIAVMSVHFRTTERISHAEVRMGRALGAVWIATFVAAWAQPYVFQGAAAMAIFVLAAAISMLMNGFFGDRAGLIGAAILLGSLLCANFLTPQMPGYTFAVGFVLGYAGPGVYYFFNK